MQTEDLLKSAFTQMEMMLLEKNEQDFRQLLLFEPPLLDEPQMQELLVVAAMQDRAEALVLIKDLLPSMETDLALEQAVVHHQSAAAQALVSLGGFRDQTLTNQIVCALTNKYYYIASILMGSVRLSASMRTSAGVTTAGISVWRQTLRSGLPDHFQLLSKALDFPEQLVRDDAMSETLIHDNLDLLRYLVHVHFVQLNGQQKTEYCTLASQRSLEALKLVLSISSETPGRIDEDDVGYMCHEAQIHVHNLDDLLNGNENARDIAYFLRTQCNLQTEQVLESIERIRSLRERAKSYVDNHEYEYAVLLSSEAIDLAEHVITFEDVPAILSIRVHAHAELKEHEKVIADGHRALSFSSTNAVCEWNLHGRLGDAYYDLNELDLATHHYEQAQKCSKNRDKGVTRSDNVS
jgi:tetratricopeptide (TPR) repeat protein